MQIQTESLLQIVKENKPEIVVEVGVYKGSTAKEIYANCPNIKEYWLVDPWLTDTTKPGRMYQQHNTQDSWNGVYEEVLKKFKNNPIFKIVENFSVEAAKVFAPKYADLVFIDANHTYEDVIKDIDAWTPIVKDGGILCGDDYFNYLVKKAVHEKFGDRVSDVNNRVWWIKL